MFGRGVEAINKTTFGRGVEAFKQDYDWQAREVEALLYI
jgi:hypothetical protein